ncbi:MAG: rRNA maturation RNase YbeY [bacterium]|nr:rRNA maturation RNase YbeY [bacterium]
MVRLSNSVGAPISKALVTRVVQAFRSRWPRARGKAVTVALVDRVISRRLNRAARGVNAPTDVLSFPSRDDASWPKPVERILGEVVICYPIAVRQAKTYRHSTRREVIELLIHGLAHLAGFDHDTKTAAVKMGVFEAAVVVRALSRTR